MSEQQGSSSNPPTAATPPPNPQDAAAFDLMASMLKAQWAKDLKKEKEKEAMLVVPNLEKKGFQVQVSFNIDLLKTLLDETQTEGIKSVIEKLKERNTLLVNADKNPALLEQYDMAVQLKNLQGNHSDPLSTIMLAKTLASSSAPRKRKHPFQQRGPTEQRVGSPNESQLSSVRNDIAYLRRDLSLQQSGRFGAQFPVRARTPMPSTSSQKAGGIVQCFFCHQFGHISPRCPNKW